MNCALAIYACIHKVASKGAILKIDFMPPVNNAKFYTIRISPIPYPYIGICICTNIYIATYIIITSCVATNEALH